MGNSIPGFTQETLNEFIHTEVTARAEGFFQSNSDTWSLADVFMEEFSHGLLYAFFHSVANKLLDDVTYVQAIKVTLRRTTGEKVMFITDAYVLHDKSEQANIENLRFHTDSSKIKWGEKTISKEDKSMLLELRYVFSNPEVIWNHDST